MSALRTHIEFYGSGILLNTCAVFMLLVLLTPAPASSLPQDITSTSQLIKPKTIKQGTPVRISVPSVAIDLGIADGTYDKASGQWVISMDKAHFALPSVPVNDNNGTTLIYGHAQPQIFARLSELQPHARAAVYTKKYKFTYSLTSKRDVVPTDTSIFTTKGKPKLVLQTCTGLWDSHRALYSFRLESVKHI